MTTLYVVLTKAARGFGPAIGAERWDVPVEVPDGSEASYEAAETEATRQYAERFNVHLLKVWHFGTFGGGT